MKEEKKFISRRIEKSTDVVAKGIQRRLNIFMVKYNHHNKQRERVTNRTNMRFGDGKKIGYKWI